MHNNNNFYKVNNLYNAQQPWLAVPSQHGSTTTTTARMHTRFPKIADTIAKFQNPQQTTAHEPSVASSSSPYREKINQILTNWQQLQTQKKAYQEKQQSEFDQIMEEVLEHQLKELESEEEKQSNLIQQVVEEQLKHEYHEKRSTKDDKEDHLEQLEELETMFLEDEQKNQRSNKNQFDKISKLFHRKQRIVMEFDTWKQKHDMYLKQIMNNAPQMKTNKIIHLLEICSRTKKFHLRPSKP